MKTTILSLAAFSLLIPTTSFANDEAVPTSALEAVSGVWLTAGKNAKVEIADCGDGTPCGTMIEVTAEDGSTPVDGNNPDPELAGRPLVGVQMLHGFKEKSGRWKSGKIYNPENGKTYKSKLKLLENGDLEVKGCIGPICQGQTWTPVTKE